MKNFILRYAPIFLQNMAISLYNKLQYVNRCGGKYQCYRKYFNDYDDSNINDIVLEHSRRLEVFIKHSKSYSKYYSKITAERLSDFPVLEKETLLKRLNEISTLKENDAIVSLTGGTTGASMKVLYSKENTQERHALLDHFRAKYGYKLGKKCAWFSGKNIVRETDLRMGVCYRDDYINKIRFFSTFHIADRNFDVYWPAFCKFAPEYIVGFPSSVYELCAMAATRGLKLENTVKVFFPTAETLLPIHREVISAVLNCKIADQYASSEGAPFILECEKGGLHIHPLTGVFEVVDENMQPDQEGEILVTSFTTEGTPLIRYRIGDRIKLAPEGKKCSCGSLFQLVEKIEGRSTDYIFSLTHGKVNLGNISNSTKDVKGVLQFQVIQYELNSVDVHVIGTNAFTNKEQLKLVDALSERFGPEMTINLKLVESIEKEASGKFRIVKNMIG